MRKSNPKTGSIQFPDVFKKVESGRDPPIELVLSQSIQRTHLYKKDSINHKTFYNSVGSKIGVIFVNNRVKDLMYRPRDPTIDDEIKYTKKLFESLGFESIRVHHNWIKADVVSELQQLNDQATNFVSVDGKKQAIFVRWIGYNLDLGRVDNPYQS